MNQTATLTEERPLVVSAPAAPALREMLEDGIYLLFLLKEGNAPGSAVEFNRRVDNFLAQFDRNARNFGKDPAAIGQARYAFCALMDEIILSSDFPLRDEWERMPLQLRLFGEHLAGEGFFNRLEQLRLSPVEHQEELEVFYTCLLLGFKGKYLLEGDEKLGYLMHKLSQEIQQARGGKAEFAPNWQLPQRFQVYMRHELPLWLYFALLAVVGAGIFGAFRWILSQQAAALLGG
ncbi:type VI secretion system protein ImpK [Xenophilus sp. AP218F]|nr:type IVB secretion system protein IcmH/DotU [Chromobacterium sp. ASV5]OWY37116.1 type VI secretion system protein ImpK [Xenophilus sp. AP218F]